MVWRSQSMKDSTWIQNSPVAEVATPGGSLTGGLMDRRGAEVRPEDETINVAIAGSGHEVHVVVAGGPAGAFIYALLPYGGGFASREIRTVP